MDTVLIAYATREGQARRIAEYLGRELGAWGFPVDVINTADGDALDWPAYGAVVLVASVHAGKHEREMLKFVRAHAGALDERPNAFLSVTLSEAGAEDQKAPSDHRAHAAADVQMLIDRFIADAGWRPQRVMPVAGALMYSKYNPIVRFFMKRIARKNGASTDTSHDVEFTDWAALTNFARTFAATLRERRGAVPAPARMAHAG